jgi:hypothetical protein
MAEGKTRNKSEKSKALATKGLTVIANDREMSEAIANFQ